MTDLKVQRRMAAEILKCGENRVWIDSLHNEDVAQAITREDVRRLISSGHIQKRRIQGTSRGRARHHLRQIAKGRRRGPGSREGAKGARNPSKAAWMRKIRALRSELKELRAAGDITPSQYRHYYRRAKGGVYTSRGHLLNHLKIDGVLTDAQIAARTSGGES